MNETSRWLPRLDPPPGGLEQLRARLHERRRHHQLFPRTAAAALAVLVLVVGGLLLRPAYQFPKQSARSASATVHATQGRNDSTIVVHNGAALELPSHNPNVRIYLVASRPTPTGSSGHGEHPI